MEQEIIFLLDRSRNMAGKEAEAVAEYNDFILRNGRGDYKVTTVLFDDRYELLYHCLPIRYAQLYPEQYYIRGACALYDTIGRAVTAVGARHAQLAENKRPKTYLLIKTNGAEDASRTYTGKMVKELLERQKQKHGWEIFFIGCDAQAVLEAKALDPAGESVAQMEQEDEYFAVLLRLLDSRRLQRGE